MPAISLPGARHQLIVDPDEREAAAAFALILDAINFGSGWWPTIRKRLGLSWLLDDRGGAARALRRGGSWPVAELAAIDSVLWNRGRARRYKERPRPRNTAY